MHHCTHTTSYVPAAGLKSCERTKHRTQGLRGPRSTLSVTRHVLGSTHLHPLAQACHPLLRLRADVARGGRDEPGALLQQVNVLELRQEQMLGHATNPSAAVCHM